MGRENMVHAIKTTNVYVIVYGNITLYGSVTVF